MICLTQEQINTIKNAFATKDVTIASLVEMTSKARLEKLQTILGKEAGLFFTEKLEGAIASGQAKNLKRWAESLFATPKEKQTKEYKDVVKTIIELSNNKILNPEKEDAILDTLIAKKLGIGLSAAEAKEIDTLTEELKKYKDTRHKVFTMLPSMEYFKARRKLINYIESLTPLPARRLFFGTIGRGNLLFGIKSAVTNIISNTASLIPETITRRMTSRWSSDIPFSIRKQYIQYAMEVYRKTKFDVTRSMSLLEDRKSLDEEIMSAQGKGGVRKAARFYEDVVFNGLMGYPDILFSAFHFSDSVALYATKHAAKLKLKGKERKDAAMKLFMEATGFDPVTVESHVLRQQGNHDAMYATFTDNKVLTKYLLDTRNFLNSLLPNYRLGDNIEPFIKTPANVVFSSLDYSGIKAVYDFSMLIKSRKTGDEAQIRESWRMLARAGLGIFAAVIIASLFDPEDYIGEYIDTTDAEKQLVRLNRATYNSIKIGDRWVSVDYFGFLGVPLTAMLNAKKKLANKDQKDSDVLVATKGYLTGNVIQLRRLPIINKLWDLVEYGIESKQYQKTDTEMVNEMLGGSAHFLYSRTIPMIISDIAKGTDGYQRYDNYKKWSDNIQMNVPIARTALPLRYDIFGEAIPTENFVSTLLFGARVKKTNDNEAVEEINRLSRAGFTPNINMADRNYKDIRELRDVVSDREYTLILGTIGERVYEVYMATIESPNYQNLDSDEKKMKLLNKSRSRAIRATIEELDLESIVDVDNI